MNTLSPDIIFLLYFIPLLIALIYISYVLLKNQQELNNKPTLKELRYGN